MHVLLVMISLAAAAGNVFQRLRTHVWEVPLSYHSLSWVLDKACLTCAHACSWACRWRSVQGQQGVCAATFACLTRPSSYLHGVLLGVLLVVGFSASRKYWRRRLGA